MFLLFLPLSFLIPSSSGLATVAMPITAPLAGFVDVPESIVVTAYQSASGLMNLFIPTSAVVMGGLAIARVPYGTYLRWVWPLLGALGVLCIVVLERRGGGLMTFRGKRIPMSYAARWVVVLIALVLVAGPRRIRARPGTPPRRRDRHARDTPGAIAIGLKRRTRHGDDGRSCRAERGVRQATGRVVRARARRRHRAPQRLGRERSVGCRGRVAARRRRAQQVRRDRGRAALARVRAAVPRPDADRAARSRESGASIP